MNDEVHDGIEDDVVVSRKMAETCSSAADTSRRLYGSSMYSEVSVGSGSLMSERVVRCPQYCGSVLSFVDVLVIIIVIIIIISSSSSSSMISTSTWGGSLKDGNF